MTTTLYLFVAMMGWCGTKWPGWWWGPKGPFGPKKPQPDPWKLVGGLIGAGGGVGASVVFEPIVRAGGFVEMASVGFFGGLFAASLVSALTGFGERGFSE